ncbi:MAG: leucine-rich repeat domain-containing protein [Planctomycetales bacterium]|nr:leucine-rich repeat domain-containing protein [Planctomycetales bacterium]
MKFLVAYSVAIVILFNFRVVSAEDLFPDKGLEAAVRHEVFAKRYNEEPLTKDDVKNISQLHGKGKGIKSLAGLENCLAIQEIDLENNEIVDLEPMRGLKLLLSINLAGNKIESIEPLSELTRVQYLELSGNAVQGIGPIAKMINMRSLYLSNNKIEKIEVFENLPKVWTCYLAGNPVKDFGPVGKLRWLSSADFSNCHLENLDFLRPLSEIKYLNCQENKLSDLQVLVEMAQSDKERRFAPFWEIYLKGNPLSEKAKTEQLEALKSLGARLHLE